MMELTIKIDKRSKQAKVFFEYLKTLPFIEMEEVQKPVNNPSATKKATQAEIIALSKEINRGLRLRLDKEYNK